MSVLSSVQRACLTLGVPKPASLVGNTDRDASELLEHAQEAVRTLLKKHDWQVLRRRETITGDGTETAFSLPADYDRMIKDAELWSSRLETPLQHILSTDHWLELDVRTHELILSAWTLLGGQLQFRPAPVLGETIDYYYVSKNLIEGSNGVVKVEFTADEDCLRIDEDLLRLAVIWTWKASKGLPYSEEMNTFEMALAEEVMRDRGAFKMTFGRRLSSAGADWAYPRSVGQ